jgi:hypothetical protein
MKVEKWTKRGTRKESYRLKGKRNKNENLPQEDLNLLVTAVTTLWSGWPRNPGVISKKRRDTCLISSTIFRRVLGLLWITVHSPVEKRPGRWCYYSR